MTIASLLLLLPLAQAEDPKPVSLFTEPLWLGAEPPACRSVRNIHVAWGGAPGVPEDVTRTREQAYELAWHVRALLDGGQEFEALAKEHSDAQNARKGAVLGTFPSGTLAPEMEAFLFAAPLGGVSDPIETLNGFHLVQRVARFAGVAQIMIAGRTPESERKAQELLDRIAVGELFSDLARKHSDHAISAGYGGLVRVFERQPKQGVLPQTAFKLPIGAVAGPVASADGFHLVKRVHTREFPDELRPIPWARVSAILIASGESKSGAALATRSGAEAEALARALRRRARADGEDFATLASAHTDEPTGRARGGDLGWLFRQNHAQRRELSDVFQAAVGEVLEPLAVDEGWVVLRRDR